MKQKSIKKVRPCNPNQERNPFTNRCNLKCVNGKERNPVNFKCRKSCIPPKTRNASTNRCRKPSVIAKKRKRKRVVKTPRKNPVRIVRKKSPIIQRDCSVCLNPTNTRTYCISGLRHPLCTDCYYRLLAVGIHYCPICREYMDKKPGL